VKLAKQVSGELERCPRTALYAKIEGMKLALALLVFAIAAPAADLDGHWNAQLARGKKADAQPPVIFSLDMKTADGKVTGTVAFAGKKRPQIEKIENGRLDGQHLTFTTTQKGKNPVNYSWDITLQDGQLTGSRMRDGAKHSQGFTATRN
jgi:hypothetical protein